MTIDPISMEEISAALSLVKGCDVKTSEDLMMATVKALMQPPQVDPSQLAAHLNGSRIRGKFRRIKKKWASGQGFGR